MIWHSAVTQQERQCLQACTGLGVCATAVRSRAGAGITICMPEMRCLPGSTGLSVIAPNISQSAGVASKA